MWDGSPDPSVRLTIPGWPDALGNPSYNSCTTSPRKGAFAEREPTLGQTGTKSRVPRAGAVGLWLQRQPIGDVETGVRRTQCGGGGGVVGGPAGLPERRQFLIGQPALLAQEHQVR